MDRSIALVLPHLISEWHPTKNGSLTPDKVPFGSGIKYWWKCQVDIDHEWEASPNNRARHSCPCCSGHKLVPSTSLVAKRPDLAKMWDFDKNDKEPQNVLGGGHTKYWWKCPVGEDHTWLASVNGLRNRGCPFCQGKRVCRSNSLETREPSIAKMWHPTKNGNLRPSEFTHKSGRKVWWKCDLGSDHEWQAPINNLVCLGSGCPCCANRKLVPSNCLASTHPKFIKEWDQEKNKITPHDITAGYANKVWWRCTQNNKHVWNSSPAQRFFGDGTGCPFCRESKGENRIAAWLDRNQIPYQRQYKIKECKIKMPLPFDFAIAIKEKLFLVEYQGEQHYRPVFGEDAFIRTLRSDAVKEEFCGLKSIALIRIPFWESKSIESRLASVFQPGDAPC